MFCLSSAVAVVAVLFGLLYWYTNRCYNFWSSRGVPAPRGFLIFGNIMKFLKYQPQEVEMRLFNEFGACYGMYQGLRPILTIADAELAKQVMVKDFPNFVRRMKMNTYHHIWDKNLFMLDDEEEWKRVRSITSPTFTTGKLKGMQSMMNKSIDGLALYFDNILEAKSEPQAIDTRDVIAGLTIDIIATTTFACETNTNDPLKRDQHFLKMATGLFKVNPLKAMIAISMPRWFNDLVGIRHFFNDESLQFFYNLTKQIVRLRQKTGSNRTDLVQLLLNARINKTDLKSIDYDKLAATMTEEREVANTTGDDRLTEDEIIAQCIIFFVGGFETTANTLTLMLYELAKDQDAQDKLVAEINESLGDLDANTPEYYDKVMRELPYLEAVMKETLRRYPPLPRATRKAGKDTEVNGIAIAEGTEVHLSIYALHHNPQYYQDPERWNPERFMPENKDQLTPYAYLPFGTGPRNCVGMRFAYQEIKFCMAKLLPQFRFTANEQTPAKIEFHRGRGNLAPVSSTVSVSKR